MEQFPNFFAPALTPEGLYSQDQKRRKWDETEERIRRSMSLYYNLRSGFAETSVKRLRQIDEELQDLEWQRRQLYFERHRILSK